LGFFPFLPFRPFLLCALVALSFACVFAAAEEAPVPEGFSLPNIFNPVLDRADGRDQAKVLVNLVAKEPKVAYGVGGPEAAITDTWNGEKDPESMASVGQKKMLREVTKLTALIAQGKKILKILPKKEKRLAKLKSKLSVILNAKAKREASEKLDQQQALLDAIKKREGAMSKRLKALKSSQGKLEKSVRKLNAIIKGKKGKRKGRKGRKSRRKLRRKGRKGKKGKKPKKSKKSKKGKKGKKKGKKGKKKGKKGKKKAKKGKKGKKKAKKGKKGKKGKKKGGKKKKKLTLKQWQAAAKKCKGDKKCLKKLGKKPKAAKKPRFAELSFDQEAEIGALVETEAEQQAQDELME